MRPLIISILILTMLFSGIASASIIDLTLNQYYDIETGDYGTNNASMDFYCSVVNNIGVAHKLKPANNAWEATISGNQTNIIGQAWSKAQKDLNYNYFFTTEGNYARIHSTSATNGFCEFNSVGSRDSNFTNVPFFPLNATNKWATVQAVTYLLNDSAGVGIDIKSLGIFPFNTTTIQASQNFDSLLSYWANEAVYANIGDVNRSSIVDTTAGQFKQISYLTNNLNCPLYASHQTNLNMSNLNDGGIYAFCIYPFITNPQPLVINGSLTTGMLALLHLDEDGTTFPLFNDSSGNNNSGICVQADCTERVKGVFNNAQNFDYSAQRAIQLTNLTDNPIDFSVSIWARPNISAYIPDQKQIMITKSSAWLLWQSADDLPYLWIWDQDFNLYTSAASINVTGAWHNLAFTVNSTTKESKLYVDGVLYNTNSMPTYNRSYQDNEAVLLGLMSGYDQLYNGDLDEVVIWNRTLSSAEIKAVYDRSTHKDYALAGGLMINETGQTAPNLNFKPWRINLAYYNLSDFNIITDVSHTPANPQAGATVTVGWVSTMPSTGYLYYRHAPFNTNNYSSWYFVYAPMNDNIHTATINNTIDATTYQYYVTAGGVIANNSGAYYNFTVEAFGALGGSDASLPTAISRLEASGFCSGSTCVYIFGFLIVGFVAVLSFFFGGVKLGATITASSIVMLAVIGLLPWFMLVPIVLYVVVFIVRHFNPLGGGGGD